MQNYSYRRESLEERREREYDRRRQQKRSKRREAMRKKRKRQALINRCFFAVASIVAVLFVTFFIKLTIKGISSLVKGDDINGKMQGSDDTDLLAPELNPIIDIVEPEPESEPVKTYEAHLIDNTVTTGSDVISERSVVIDVDTGDILMQKGYKDRISPASMTKVLTVLVAAENLSEDQLNDTFTITEDITSYVWKYDCSAVCWANDETVTVKDLLYGTILPSGADAAIGLATYIAGSQEAFVELMNEKIAELGLSETTHFTNCVGLYDENHYSTCYDIAMIMEAAIDNPLALEVLSTKKYTTSVTTEHPSGIEISNWFLRRIEDKDTGGEVVAAKTGFVNESRNCAVSYGIDTSGNRYVICSQGSTSSWRCIYDHVAMYKQFEGKVNHGSAEVTDISEDETEGDNI